MKNLVKSAFVALVVCVFAIPASAESLMIAPVNGTGYCGEKGYRGERRSSDAIGSGKSDLYENRGS